MKLSLFQKLSSTVLGPVTYVFSSSSLDLSQLTPAISVFTFLQELKYFRWNIKDKRGGK